MLNYVCVVGSQNCWLCFQNLFAPKSKPFFGRLLQWNHWLGNHDYPKGSIHPLDSFEFYIFHSKSEKKKLSVLCNFGSVTYIKSKPQFLFYNFFPDFGIFHKVVTDRPFGSAELFGSAQMTFFCRTQNFFSLLYIAFFKMAYLYILSLAYINNVIIVLTKYRISSYSFRPWTVSSLE